jgi:hypothetical protein
MSESYFLPIIGTSALHATDMRDRSLVCQCPKRGTPTSEFCVSWPGLLGLPAVKAGIFFLPQGQLGRHKEKYVF